MRSIKEESMECPHMIKSVSTAGIRKKLKGDIKSFCHPCTFKAFESINEHWFCLQCGNIGCGDIDAQSGDAVKHFNTPRSDLHSIVVHLEKDSKCWCFECKMEVNSKSAHLKDAITLVKRNIKYRNAQKAGQQQKVDIAAGECGEKSGSNAVSSSIAIPLPPPSPAISLSNSDSNKKGSFSGRNYHQNKGSVSDDSVIPRPTDKPFGLQNLGNTCFMNSTLQCLASTRLLLPKLQIFGNGQELRMLVTQTEDEALVTVLHSDDAGAEVAPVLHQGNGDVVNNNFLSKVDDASKALEITLEISPESMTGRLQHTLKAIRKDQSFSVVPGVVRESYAAKEFFGWGESLGFRPRGVHDLIGKNFRPGQQHDAHELLRTIVDMMKKDQTKAFRKSIMKHYGMEIGGEGSDPKLVDLVKTLDQKVKHKTFVDDVFGGELMTIQTCLTCKSAKKSFEQFLDLSLPIRVMKHPEENGERKPVRKSFSLFEEVDKNIVINKTLVDCLRCFTEPELLTGSNAVECENCHKLNLAKLEAGVPFEEVFPSILTEKANPKTEKGAKRIDDRKKKRPTRQQKLRNQADRTSASASISETEVLLVPQPEDLDLIENHFDLPPAEGATKCKPVEDPEKKIGGDSSSNQSGSLDDYVVIQSDITKASTSGSTKRKLNEMETPDSEQEAFPANPENLSESLNNLNLQQLDEIESMGEDYDDLDLPPAVDGIGGSASDEEEDNGVPHLSLDLPNYDKFESFQHPEPDIPCETGAEKPAKSDEGFSEGENSASMENDTGHQQRSQASSRNSISDPDEVTKSSGPQGQETEKESPRVQDQETEKEIPGVQDQETEKESPGIQDRETEMESPRVQDEETEKESPTVQDQETEKESPRVQDQETEKESPRVQDQETEKESPRVSVSESEEEVPIVVEPPKIPKVTRCPCSRQQTISRPPEFLTVHLKRFQISYGGTPTKVSNHVLFPLALDLAPFCYPGEGDSDGSGVFDEEGQVLYSLYGIVEHGGSLNWGHYTSHVKTDGDKWFYISDSNVSSASLKSVKEVEAYILFYERVRSPEEKRRLSLLEPDSEEFKVDDNIWSAWDVEPQATTPTVTATATSWNEVPETEDWDHLTTQSSSTVTEWNSATEPLERGVEVWSESVTTGIEWGSNAQVLEWNEEEPLPQGPEIQVTSEGFSETASAPEQMQCTEETLTPQLEILSTDLDQFPIKEEELMDTL